jgi:hypothetical protein
MDPTWMLQRIVDQNPLVRMAEVNGLLVNVREMPREVQMIAHEKGLIPTSRRTRNSSGVPAPTTPTHGTASGG